MDIDQLKTLINGIIDERLGELVGNTQDLMEKRLYEILEGQAAYHMTDKLAGEFEKMFDKAYVGIIKAEYVRIMEGEVEKVDEAQLQQYFIDQAPTPTQPNYDGEGGDYAVPVPTFSPSRANSEFCDFCGVEEAAHGNRNECPPPPEPVIPRKRLASVPVESQQAEGESSD